MSDHLSTLILSIMVVGALIAAAFDIKTRRIPNILTGSLAAIAIAVHIPHGFASVGMTMLVMIAAFLVGSFTFSLGWFGGGDVKLLTACCGFAGLSGSLELLLYVFIAGGIVCLIEILRKRRLRLLLTGIYQSTLRSMPGTPIKVPYGVAIAVGTCAYTLSTTPALHFLRLSL